jgi:hypothetical protein
MRCLSSLPADDPIRQVAVSRQEDSRHIQYAGDNMESIRSANYEIVQYCHCEVVH